MILLVLLLPLLPELHSQGQSLYRQGSEKQTRAAAAPPEHAGARERGPASRGTSASRQVVVAGVVTVVVPGRVKVFGEPRQL